jgi:hypothetical protein
MRCRKLDDKKVEASFPFNLFRHSPLRARDFDPPHDDIIASMDNGGVDVERFY